MIFFKPIITFFWKIATRWTWLRFIFTLLFFHLLINRTYTWYTNLNNLIMSLWQWRLLWLVGIMLWFINLMIKPILIFNWWLLAIYKNRHLSFIKLSFYKFCFIPKTSLIVFILVIIIQGASFLLFFALFINLIRFNWLYHIVFVFTIFFVYKIYIISL